MSVADQSRLQTRLHTIGMVIGSGLQARFDEDYLRDWRDEEATTAGLATLLRERFSNHREEVADDETPLALSARLRGSISTKREEAEHGADLLIYFVCDLPTWRLRTMTLIQAKRQEPGAPLDARDRDRLSRQLNAMLGYSSEALVMIYSTMRGIQLVPAVAARALGTSDLFDLATIDWSWFLSGLLRGRFGDPVAARAPYLTGGLKDPWILELTVAEQRPADRPAPRQPPAEL